MQEVESLSSLLWWVFPLVLFCAVGCFVQGAEHALTRAALSRRRDVLFGDLQLAEFLAQVKPPPYGLYAVCWIAAGTLLLLAAFMLRR